ncbi:MAG TPA: protein kinase [Bryobacteraceae bacterium]|nr:protein kinase [Bryobacteraceae bacterium]
MSLAPGTKLGPYEIVGQLGAGGMGEVYRARDTRLGRDVALKLLPDPANRERFEQEAKAVAALNHPNIMAVFDVGDNYFVSELVEGDSLRHLDPMPLRKAIEIAAQIADGLAAAHAAGIVHRDLKPDNIMLTRDGRAKILDFGLARVVVPTSDDPDATQAISKTDPGAVMGTVGYMSPEQVRGRPADHRSDIFSFGLVLYEMLGGKRAFTGDSAVETMNAILTQDPPDLPATVPTGVVQIVNHCIEKNPGDRFQSARDLAFGLRALTTPTQSSGQIQALTTAPGPMQKARPWPLIAIAMMVVAAAAGVWIARSSVPVGQPRFTRLTYQRGYVSSARFAPDGKTLVYSAAWDGDPFEIFSSRVESIDSRPLSIPNAHVFSVSSSGDLAIGLEPHMTESAPHGLSATLARVPLAGGAPRPLLKDVFAADWEPKSDRLAVVHMVEGTIRVEFPPGKPIYQTNGWISTLRFSPDGKHIAIADHPLRWDDRGDVALLDLEGHKTVVSGGWEAIEGVGWSPSGAEVWFAAAEAGDQRTIFAVTLSGKRRQILENPSAIVLHDIGADGRMLITNEDGARKEMISHLAGDPNERNLAYLNMSLPADLSADGKMLLFTELTAGKNYAVCLRKTDGSPPVVLGEGMASSLSSDGQSVLAILNTTPQQLVLLPTGAGETVRLPNPGLAYQLGAQWLPDSKRIVFAANGNGKAARLYVQSVAPPDQPRAFTPEWMSISGNSVSPDGKMIVARQGANPLAIYPIDGSAPQPIPGVNPTDQFIRWSADGGSLFFASDNGCHAGIYKLNWRNGAQVRARELMPNDQAGVFGINPILLTPDGASTVYGYMRVLLNLQLVDGVK